jgi:hypothetical protein
MQLYHVSNGDWAVPVGIPEIKQSTDQTFKPKKKKLECSNEQNFPIIYQYPSRVVDVEADPSEDSAACVLLREFLAIRVQKGLWSGPFFF